MSKVSKNNKPTQLSEKRRSCRTRRPVQRQSPQTPSPKRRQVTVRSSCADVLREVEEELPKYDRRGYNVEGRLSIALCYATYLEGLLAASAPEDAPVPEEEVPLISRFGFYKVMPCQKSETPRDVTKESPGLASALFPELQLFPGDEWDTSEEDTEIGQPDQCDGEAWCCCPSPEDHVQASEEPDGEASSQESSQELCSYVSVLLSQEDSARDMAHRADNLRLVLSRMESAVQLAVRVTTPSDLTSVDGTPPSLPVTGALPHLF